MSMNRDDVDRMIKQLMLKDLRVQCRARGLSPAGGKEQLSDRLAENMMATRDFSIKSEAGEDIHSVNQQAGVSTDDMVAGHARNNYQRPDGQNVGNFLTDRNSSRVLAPPGGGSSIVFGDAEPAGAAAAKSMGRAPMPAAASKPGELSSLNGAPGHVDNNYSRPSGQNVGNFLSERHMVKVAAPPGGASQIMFG